MSEELQQLALVIAGLIIAFAGVKYWTGRIGGRRGGREGGDARMPGLADGEDAGGIAPLDDAVAQRAGGGSRTRGERFQLQGKDAEVAARVLKRMLKQDEEGT